MEVLGEILVDSPTSSAYVYTIIMTSPAVRLILYSTVAPDKETCDCSSSNSRSGGATGRHDLVPWFPYCSGFPTYTCFVPSLSPNHHTVGSYRRAQHTLILIFWWLFACINNADAMLGQWCLSLVSPSVYRQFVAL